MERVASKRLQAIFPDADANSSAGHVRRSSPRHAQAFSSASHISFTVLKGESQGGRRANGAGKSPLPQSGDRAALPMKARLSSTDAHAGARHGGGISSDLTRRKSSTQRLRYSAVSRRTEELFDPVRFFRRSRSYRSSARTNSADDHAPGPFRSH